MRAAPPSPGRLAVWLSVPLVLLAVLGIWLVRAEQARVEVELRREAERWAPFVLEEIGSARTEEAIDALAVFIPTGEPPAPGPEAAELAAARDELRAGKRDEAIARLETLLARPNIAAAVSEAGLPLLPLVCRLLYEAAPGSQNAAMASMAAVQHPSLVSLQIFDDVSPEIQADAVSVWRHRAIAAEALRRDLTAGRAVTGWHVEAGDSGVKKAIPLAEVSALVRTAAAGTQRLLPQGLGVRVEWNGHDVLPAPGAALATGVRAPWRVGLVLADPAALQAAATQRMRWLGVLLGAALAVTAFALWVAWRAFRRQAELARLQMEFVASVSHELRTPVASITALAERLEGGQADAAQTADYHRFIGREGRRLASLVENVLDFSRLERGRKAFTLDHADIPSLVRETAALMRPRAEEKGLTLTEAIAAVPEERWPLVDALALRQALVNLLDNAVKFTPAGGRIELEFAEEKDAPIFRVSDTGIGIDPGEHERIFERFHRVDNGLTRETTGAGIGIDPGEHERIFERFHRVDNGLTRETTGAGIGLSLVRHIAGAHGATVRVESEPGRFSRFTLHFPPVPCASC